MPKVSAVIIALNEEKNIAPCIDSVRFCDEVVVIDSGSQDGTRQKAESLGAKVFEKRFSDFAAQKNYGIEKAGGEWVLLIDADERVSVELGEELKSVLKTPEGQGYYFLRQNRIFGRWMRHGGNQGDYQLRLVKKNGSFFEGSVHERIRVDGKTSRLKGPLLHYSTATAADYMRKLNLYTSMEAKVLKERAAQAQLRTMKWRPPLVFLYRFIWQKGILDSLEGMLFAVLSAYYEFIRYAKLWELSNLVSDKIKT